MKKRFKFKANEYFSPNRIREWIQEKGYEDKETLLLKQNLILEIEIIEED